MKKQVIIQEKDISLDRFARQPYLIIILFSLAVYIQVSSFGFTGFDDDFLIVNNMEQLGNFNNVNKLITDNSFLSNAVYGFYRPLQTLVFMLNAVIGNGSLIPFHLTSIILHCLSSCLLLIIFRTFGNQSYTGFTKPQNNKPNERFNNISFLGVLIYSIHPLFSINVAWLPAMGDLLISVFCLSSFLMLIKYLSSKKIHFLILHIFLLFLGFLSKETAVLFPGLMFFYVLFFKQLSIPKNSMDFNTSNKNSIEKENTKILKFQFSHIFIYFSWIIIIGIWYILRASSIKELPGGEVFGITPFLENLRTIPEFISKFILPYNLMPLPVFDLAVTIIGIIILLVVIYLLIVKKDYNKKAAFFGFLWFLILTLPGMFYSRNYPNSEQFYHYLDHRAYMPMAGILLILICLFYNSLTKYPFKRILLSGVVIAVIFSIISFMHVKIYSNPSKFLEEAVQSNPKGSVAYFLRGNINKDMGEIQRAVEDYSNAIRINNEYAEALNNRGAIYGMAGDYGSSIKDLSKAVKLDPDIPDGYFNLAIAEDAVGNFKGAITNFSRALKINPNDPQNYFLRANSYSKIGEINNSIKDYTTAIALLTSGNGSGSSNNILSQIFFNRGNTFSRTGRSNEAISDFSSAINIDPNYANAYLNRGIEKYRLNDLEGACRDWQKAADEGNNGALQMIQRYCK